MRQKAFCAVAPWQIIGQRLFYLDALADLVEHLADLMCDLVVREAKNGQATTGNNLITLGVVFWVVNGSINFDHESRPKTVEVSDKTVDDLLAAKVDAEFAAS